MNTYININEVYSMDNKYELITPIGKSLMAACLTWQQDQGKPENAIRGFLY